MSFVCHHEYNGGVFDYIILTNKLADSESDQTVLMSDILFLIQCAKQGNIFHHCLRLLSKFEGKTSFLLTVDLLTSFLNQNKYLFYLTCCYQVSANQSNVFFK